MTAEAQAPSVTERHLRILGTRNFRDIGGYPAGNRRQTRWRTLFRADALDQLSPAAQQTLIELGLRTVIDLRRPDELETNPNVFRASTAVRYRHLAMFDIDPGHPDGPIGWYRSAAGRWHDRLAAVVNALLEPGALPAVVHCAAGKDRTGIVIGLVLAAVGVPREAIVDDYGLTKTCFTTRWVESADEPGGIGQVVDDEAPVVDTPPEWIGGFLDELDERYGGAEAYLVRGGLRQSDVARLRQLLTEPVGSVVAEKGFEPASAG